MKCAVVAILLVVLFFDTNAQGKSKSFNKEMPANAGTIILKALSDPGKQVLNFENFNLLNKKILLDFFFERCVPCVKAYPLMIDLHNNRDSSYVIIGIDPMLSDTASINSYLSKHGINYPVIYGNAAFNLAKQLNVTAFPRFIMINPGGEILFSEFGISQKNFLKIKGELRSTNKN